MVLEVNLTDDDISGSPESRNVSRNGGFMVAVAGAAHLAMTEQAVRALVEQGQIPFHRTGSGRIRFERGELDAWVRAPRLTLSLRSWTTGSICCPPLTTKAPATLGTSGGVARRR